MGSADSAGVTLAKAKGIPVVHCPVGERKHELAEEYLAKSNITQGLFVILVGAPKRRSETLAQITQISDAPGLAKIADTLSAHQTIGRLHQACERWIYTTCLCFALDLEEQKRSGVHYQYSIYQVEFS
jgi:hypothetical protein